MTFKNNNGPGGTNKINGTDWQNLYTGDYYNIAALSQRDSNGRVKLATQNIQNSNKVFQYEVISSCDDYFAINSTLL